MIDRKSMYEWCSIPVGDLMDHPKRKIPLKIVKTPAELGEVMAEEFANDINNAGGRLYHAIVPCGPKEWYAPFAKKVNEQKISLKNVVVFHMDENLDWEGKLLPEKDPNNFRTFMDEFFYAPIDPELSVAVGNRHYLTPKNYIDIAEHIERIELDYTLGGWGQDGHLAYNQARRNPYSPVSLDEVRNSTVRIQDNNFDTLMAIGHRNFGAAWQFVAPMSVTLGVKECLKAKKVRVYSGTGAWKQTALRVALFSEPNAEYPMTLMQEHPDALITVTEDTANHPFAQNPDWQFRGVNV